MVCGVALLLVIGSAAIFPSDGITYVTNVTGLIKDGVPFRVLCHLNTTTQSLFNMMVFGYSANKTLLISARISFIGVFYQMALYAKTINKTLTVDYNQTYMDDLSGIPAIPIVMGFGQGTFFVTSYQKGLNASIVDQAESLARIEVAWGGSNMVDCGPVECFRGK